MINAIGEPKVLYCVDLISVHGAPSVNSFGQSVNNPLCDTLHEGFFSKASTGRDEIDKPAASHQRCADDAEGTRTRIRSRHVG